MFHAHHILTPTLQAVRRNISRLAFEEIFWRLEMSLNCLRFVIQLTV